MDLTVRKFYKWAIDLIPISIDRYFKENVFWIVPAPVCRMWFVKIASYFTEDTSPLLRLHRRRNVVSLPLTKCMCRSCYTS